VTRSILAVSRRHWRRDDEEPGCWLVLLAAAPTLPVRLDGERECIFKQEVRN
jgi:hypothetical protein